MIYIYQTGGKDIRVEAPHIEAVLKFARSTGKQFSTPRPCPSNDRRWPDFTLSEEGELSVAWRNTGGRRFQ